MEKNLINRKFKKKMKNSYRLTVYKNRYEKFESPENLKKKLEGLTKNGP